MLMVILFSVISGLLAACNAQAGDVAPADRQLDMSQYLAENKFSFLPVPMVITEPAVGYGGGLFGLFLHGKGTQSNGRFIPPALTVFGGGGTQNGTWFVGGGHRHTWNNDHIRYLVVLGYGDINLDIYSGDLGGFGGDKAIKTETKGYGGLQKILFRVKESPVFLGASQFYVHTTIAAHNPAINQLWRQVMGEESTTSAFGLVAEYDTTDNFFYPHNGLSLSAEYRVYGQFLGGDYRYDQLTVEGKYFLPLTPVLTLALAGNYQWLDSHESHLTPMARPYVALRGISRYRYQGDIVGTVQSQLAWQITPRWSLLGFVGAGNAATQSSELFRAAEVAWGSGFRYLIAEQYGLQTGLDVAFSDSQQAVYFNVGVGL
ncbi:BamA/TamA family outer membrane protein [Shimwellia pseudoproteus]|nr:BamA/TamA family outer membrane protein [Shimwellia pseudoproteus]